MNGLKILFANDDVLTQWVMSDVLDKVGFQVTSVCRSQRISELLAAECEFDLLLLDLQLPDLGESAVVRQWRRASLRAPIVYTGPNRNGLMQPLQRNESFLLAPFTPSALLHAIEEALDEAWLVPLVPAPAKHLSYVN